MVNELEQSIRGRRARMIPRKPFEFKISRAKQEARQLSSREREKQSSDTIDNNNDDNGNVTLQKLHMEEPTASGIAGESLVYEHLEERKNFAFYDLTDCCISVQGVTRAVRLNGLLRCKVFLGPVTGSVLLHNCHNTTFELATGQLRIHTSTDCTFQVVCRSGPIIEDCSRLVFGCHYPTNVYLELEDHLEEAQLSLKCNQWRDIKDFCWLRQEPSPNFSLLQLE